MSQNVLVLWVQIQTEHISQVLWHFENKIHNLPDQAHLQALKLLSPLLSP